MPQLSDSSQKNILRMAFFLGICIPLILTAFFYLNYARHAWFLQDDFGFLKHYSSSVWIKELFDFSSFGRFVSRNIYWHYGIRLFSFDARYFYLFNVLTIAATSCVLYRIFSRRYGGVAGAVAALLYFTFPTTIETYSWLSNSQHLIGHFFVVLFVYMYLSPVNTRAPSAQYRRFAILALVLMLGFGSNIFMAMVISLPAWMILADKSRRKSVVDYAVVVFGVALFLLFFIKLSGSQKGAYATSYTVATLVSNAGFYFGRPAFAALWLVATCAGWLYALLRGKHFTSWLFIASVAFLVPFAFFEHQKYIHYGTLAYLFFLLACLSLLLDVFAGRYPLLMRCLVLVAVPLTLWKSQTVIGYFQANPLGGIQQVQVNDLRMYDQAHPEVKRYCFQSAAKVENTTGVKEWDIPPDWWFVGFGKAFSLFVDAEKTYELAANAASCDATFIFTGGRLIAQERTPDQIRDHPLHEGVHMKIHYLEIVTREVDAVCAAYAAAHDVRFGEPDARLGGARTAELADGGLIGVRAPVRADEQPVVRPYWLVPDIEAALAAAVEAGGQTAVPPMKIPGLGTFAIYLQGGNEHGLWQL